MIDEQEAVGVCSVAEFNAAIRRLIAYREALEKQEETVGVLTRTTLVQIISGVFLEAYQHPEIEELDPERLADRIIEAGYRVRGSWKNSLPEYMRSME